MATSRVLVIDRFVETLPGRLDHLDTQTAQQRRCIQIIRELVLERNDAIARRASRGRSAEFRAL